MKLTIQDACKSYEGHPVLEQLCLELPEKGTVCLFGPSGCGKTTLFNCIAGLEKLDSGAILGMEGRRVAYMFQEDRLLPWINARENVEVVLRHSDEKQAQKWLEAVGLGEDGDKCPSELSGGMRQRVMIAMALACRPKLLIADEPTTALDVTIQAQILKLMNELKEQTGASILFITHDLGVIHEMADEVAVMYCGQIVEKASAKTIFHNGVYSHPYTEALMTSIPRLNTPKGQRLEAIPGAVPNPLYLPQGCKFAPRCKYCTQKCMEAEPPLQEVAPNHLVRCFYAEKAGRKDNVE